MNASNRHPLHILFQDQAEFYFVCEDCYADMYDMQWAGSTTVPFKNWRQRAVDLLDEHVSQGGLCVSCGPNGNGGWMTDDGRWPCAERRDKRKKEGNSGGNL